jgi:dUTP pyrophosphatase
MKVRIKRVDKSFPLPVHETKGSVGFDLICRKEKIVQKNSAELIPVNIIVETPEGYMLMLAPRGSMFRKKGLLMPNSIGIIDQDYCGDSDEIMLQVYNITNRPVIISKGEKLGQGIFVKIEQVEWKETEESMGENRGGFGSTDSD